MTDPVQEHRLRWTTFNNFDTWHDNWENFFLTLDLQDNSQRRWK